MQTDVVTPFFFVCLFLSLKLLPCSAMVKIYLGCVWAQRHGPPLATWRAPGFCSRPLLTAAVGCLDDRLLSWPCRCPYPTIGTPAYRVGCRPYIIIIQTRAPENSETRTVATCQHSLTLVMLLHAEHGRGPARYGPHCLVPNFPYVPSAATMDPLSAIARAQARKG